jgi:hypothetical protein
MAVSRLCTGKEEAHRKHRRVFLRGSGKNCWVGRDMYGWEQTMYCTGKK